MLAGSALPAVVAINNANGSSFTAMTRVET